MPRPWDQVQGQIYLGGEEFVAAHQPDRLIREIPRGQTHAQRPSLPTLFASPDRKFLFSLPIQKGADPVAPEIHRRLDLPARRIAAVEGPGTGVRIGSFFFRYLSRRALLPGRPS
jgi:hypothetical protein